MKKQSYILHAGDDHRALVLSNCQAFLCRLPSDKSWKIEIAQWHKPRSVQQNRATFGPLYDRLMEFCGYEGASEKEQLHRAMCMEFFGSKELPILGQVPLRTTTTNAAGERDVIDTATMGRFIDFVQRKAASIGCDLPSPDPFYGESDPRGAP
ncbi:MAG: NinB/YbcN family protein [Acidobacteriaceae bacterium]